MSLLRSSIGPLDNPASLPADDPTERRNTWIAAAVVAVVTLIALGRIITHEFVRWDDPGNFLENPYLKSIGYCWWHPVGNLYIPVTYTVWGLLAFLGGDSSGADGGVNPHMFHVASLLFHVTAAIGVLLVLRLLGLRSWPAAFGALIFAVHPLQTEAVAWATGLRDVLSGGLCIWAIWFYLRTVEVRDQAGCWWKQFLLATLLFLAAMLSKPQAVCLPLVIFGMEVLRRPRAWRQWMGYLLPWVVLTLPFILYTSHFQPAVEGHKAGRVVRLLIASDDLAFYTEKLIVPIDQTLDYAHSTQRLLQNGPHVLLWFVLPGLLALIGYLRLRLLWLAMGMAIFVCALMPVLGFAPFDFQRYSNVSDHYLYLAMLGPALVGAGAWQVAVNYGATRWLVRGVASAMIVLMVIATCRQAGFWKDDATLFTRNLRLQPESFAANTHMGAYNSRAGKLDEACALYRHALTIRPDDPEALSNLANVLFRQDHYDEAFEDYHRALQISPYRPQVHINFALALLKMNKPDEATEEFETANRLEPGNPNVLVHLAKLSMQHQDVLMAKAYLYSALDAHPDYAPARDLLQQLEHPAPTPAR